MAEERVRRVMLIDRLEEPGAVHLAPLGDDIETKLFDVGRNVGAENVNLSERFDDGTVVVMGSLEEGPWSTAASFPQRSTGNEPEPQTI